MKHDASDTNEAMVLRREWASRVSWYVYVVFMALMYLAILAPSAMRMIAIGNGSVSNRTQQAARWISDLLFANSEFLPIVFVAATFPLVAAYVVRGFFLLVIVGDASWIPAAAWTLALFTPISIVVKLVLASTGGSGLVKVILDDLEYFGMCSLPLVMAALLVILARYRQRSK